MKQSKVEKEEREKQQKKKKYINVIFYISYTKPYNPRFIWRPRDVSFAKLMQTNESDSHSFSETRLWQAHTIRYKIETS